MRDARCGMRDAGCEKRDARCGMGDGGGWALRRVQAPVSVSLSNVSLGD